MQARSPDPQTLLQLLHELPLRVAIGNVADPPPGRLLPLNPKLSTPTGLTAKLGWGEHGTAQHFGTWVSGFRAYGQRDKGSKAATTVCGKRPSPPK